MLVRIFTQNQNYDKVKKLVGQYFDGFTIIKAEGVWQGSSEHSLIIEIAGMFDTADCDKIDQLCYAIKKLNKQDKILVQKIQCNSELI